ELVKGGEAAGSEGAVDRAVLVELRRVHGSDDGGVRVARDVAEAATELPTGAEIVGGDERQVVGLIAFVDAPACAVVPSAAREGVSGEGPEIGQRLGAHQD